jgi:hypothetical protein
MCLIKGKESIRCQHMTCKRFALRPELFETTKKSEFFKRGDIHLIKLSRSSDNEPDHLKVSNPHKQNTGTWLSFEPFRLMVNELKAVGKWPNDSKYTKADIDIQFFPYARKIGLYNPLTEEYEYSMQLDVDEGAVYCGHKVVTG